MVKFEHLLMVEATPNYQMPEAITEAFYYPTTLLSVGANFQALLIKKDE